METGFDRLAHYKKKTGEGFVVARIEIDYVTPIRLGNSITIETDVIDQSSCRINVRQRMLRNGRKSTKIAVALV